MRTCRKADFAVPGNGSPNLGQTIRRNDTQQKKRTCQMADFAVLGDYRVKINGNERYIYIYIYIYIDLAREQKKTMEH